jgi:hypothetical protein
MRRGQSSATLRCLCPVRRFAGGYYSSRDGRRSTRTSAATPFALRQLLAPANLRPNSTRASVPRRIYLVAHGLTRPLAAAVDARPQLASLLRLLEAGDASPRLRRGDWSSLKFVLHAFFLEEKDEDGMCSGFSWKLQNRFDYLTFSMVRVRFTARYFRRGGSILRYKEPAQVQ